MLVHKPFSTVPASRLSRCICTAAVASLRIESPTQGSSTNVLTVIPFAISNGIQFAKIKPALLERGQRGILATYSINADECICSVPVKAAVRTYPGCKPALNIPQQTWAELPWYAQIALVVLECSKQGSGSRFADYVKVLPQSVDVPVLWTEEEVEQLRCQYFVEQVRQQKQQWTQLWLQLQQHLSAAGISRDEFMWALSLARSRAFAAPYTPAPLSTAPKVAVVAQVLAAAAYLAAGVGAAAGIEVAGLAAAAGVWYWLSQQSQTQQQHALCPLLDMFNHSGDEQSECELDIWSDSFRVVASRPWQAGQQVFISYGSSSNDVLLQLYGFVEANNPKDRYLVRCLLDVLATQGMQPVNSIQKQLLTEVAFTQQGIPAAAAAALEQVCNQRSSNIVDSSPEGRVPYQRLSQQARAACAAALQRELQQLDISEVEDEDVIQAFEELPAKQRELMSLQQQLQQQQDELQEQLTAPQVMKVADEQLRVDDKQAQKAVALEVLGPQQVVDTSHGSVVDAAQGGPDSAQQEAARQLIAEQTQQVLQLQYRVAELQQLVTRWNTTTAACKELAIRFRLGKVSLLTDVLLSLG